jgi:hypothetical protein
MCVQVKGVVGGRREREGVGVRTRSGTQVTGFRNKDQTLDWCPLMPDRLLLVHARGHEGVHRGPVLARVTLALSRPIDYVIEYITYWYYCDTNK